MTTKECCEIAEQIRREYNPENLSPFPYQNITADKQDLSLKISNFDGDIDSISGATIYYPDKNIFDILINSNKPRTRQHFTIAHELGHYFLHQEILKNEKIIIDDDNIDSQRVLYRIDNAERNKIETEANNFAATLIMPEDLVKDAWRRLEDIQECAKIFNVSLIAMTIRLERLGLVE